MAAATKNLAFAVTQSTTYEHYPYVFAKKITSLDHLTNGRFGWNMVTSHSPVAAKAVGLKEIIDHDLRYEKADDYVEVIYK